MPNHAFGDVGRLLADELDGQNAVSHVTEITQYHRSLGSREYDQAADYLLGYLDRAGVYTSTVDSPLDNSTQIGNYTVPPAWEPHDAVVRVVDPEDRTLVTFADAPTCINSWSAATPPEGVVAELVDVGQGDRESDYEGVDVAGKICLVSKGFAWRTHPLAVEKHGALGFINDDVLAMPPLKTRETFPDAVMWNTFYEREMDGGFVKGFGLSISPRMGDYLRGLLAQGPVKLFVKVDARTFEGTMRSPLGILQGAEHPEEEVLMTAHLCHTRPGAVDNAAGCAHITETIRALAACIERGDLPQPRRSILAFYGPEGHHTNVYPARLEKEGRLADCIAGLSSHAGGDPNQLHAPLVLTRTSSAAPHFVDDLMCYYLDRVSQTFPVPGPRVVTPFSYQAEPRFMGGDSLQLVGWGIPAIELARRPNIFWHTQYDTADKTSAEEFLKVGWVFGTVAWFLANAGPAEARWLMQMVSARSENRIAEAANETGLAALTDEEIDWDQHLDRLSYLAERDSRVVASCLSLVRHEDDTVAETLKGEAEKHATLLANRAAEARDELAALAAVPATKGG